jgi:hypothetical protein
VVLVLTNSKDATADFLCGHFETAKIEYFRVNTDNVREKLKIEYSHGQAYLCASNVKINSEQVSGIWLRRPQPLLNPEGQPAEIFHLGLEWTEALEGFLAHVPTERWINHPTANALASHKIEQLTRAQSFGLRVPETIVTQNFEELSSFWAEFPNEVIVKPLASGFIQRDDPQQDTLIYTSQLEEAHISKAELLSACPTLFQRRVKKYLDARCCVVDDECITTGMCAEESSGLQRLDIRRNNMSDVRYYPIVLPNKFQISLLSLVKSYGLRFAAIDLVQDNNRDWYFLEINPNGQWAWLDIDANAGVYELFLKAFRKT